MTHKIFRRKLVAAGIVAVSLIDSGTANAQTPAPPPNPSSRTRYNMPPPNGIRPPDIAAETSLQARRQDDQFSLAAEQWAQQNCVAQRANNATTGAVIGGVLGALITGAAGGRGGGIVLGGAAGAIAGAAIGSSAASNPNCPPGFVVRANPAPFRPPPFYGPVVYAAPDWYDPWVWYGGRWIYRPYPYHRYWYRQGPPRRR